MNWIAKTSNARSALAAVASLLRWALNDSAEGRARNRRVSIVVSQN
jgi:flagellar motor protein MotB